MSLSYSDWNFFGSIKCINLISRHDRYIQSQEVFNKLKIPVTYYQPSKHKNSTQGCFESHINIIKKSYDKGDETCLIFEDDVIDTDGFSKKRLHECINFMKKNKWDFFFLGSTPMIWQYKTKKTYNSNIINLHSSCWHAYVIHRRFMKKIKDVKYNDTPIDMCYNNNNNSYAYYPTLFRQRGSLSDITTGVLYHMHNPMFDQIKELCFDLLTKYAYHINIPIKELMISTIFVFLFLELYYNSNKVILNFLISFTIALIFLYIKIHK